MKDALILYQALLNGNDLFPLLLDCQDDELNKLMNSVYKGIQELKEKCDDKSE